MKTIKNFSLELGLEINDILEYGNELGYRITQFSNLNIAQQKAIKDRHNENLNFHKTSQDLLKCDESNSTKADITKKTSFNNPFELLQRQILNTNDNYSERELKLLIFGEYRVESKFTDFEAFTICNGLSDYHPRKIAREYFQTGKAEDLNLFEAHTYAMDTLRIYGGKKISYIISLPPLPFYAVNVDQVFFELDKRVTVQEFPILRIHHENWNGFQESLHIAFHAEKIKGIRTRDDNQLVVKNKWTGKIIMRVSRDGLITPENKARDIVPILQVFMRFCKETKQMLINYGLETGECSICGRELTDPESIKIGMGPVCRQYFYY